MTRPKVLLTNDDGIRAEGIFAMWKALSAWADVTVVAPETHQSATGHGVTLAEPLMVAPVTTVGGMTGTAVDGRPADCTKLALVELCPDVDLVVSGINMGANAGINVFYSGTVAAAIEAAFLGKPAIAVSKLLRRDVPDDYDAAAAICLDVIQKLWTSNAVHAGEVVNVNVPALKPGQQHSGIRVVPQCVKPLMDAFEERQSPRGQSYYWNTGVFSLEGGEAGTDVAGLRDDAVVVTPLHLNLTAVDRMQRTADAMAAAT
ncbi:MAG: 5'/3'-nucleotidase SurE [Planctomycetota bacterium]